MPTITVEAVAKEGHGFKDSVGWKNADKKSGLNFKELHAGDVIDATLNPAGFVTAYTLVTAGAPKKAWTPRGGSDDRSAQMSRGAAIKAVLSSPVVSQMVKDLSDEEALSKSFDISDEIATYIEKGR